MKLHRDWTPAVAVAALALLTGGWLLQAGGGKAQDRTYENRRLFEHVHQLVSERYVDDVNPSQLYRMAIDGMLYKLGDPHTSFLDPEDYEQLELSTTGNYGGLGIRIDSQDGWITVVDVFSDTPADEVGLHVGDRIIEVEAESAEGWSTTDAVKVLRGPAGSEVGITVARVGVEKPLHFTIERAKVHVEAVYASFMLDDQVGFVVLQRFSRRAEQELASSIDSLRKAGARSLILDLRGNPGGLLEQGVAISDLFLNEGTPVVSTRSRLEDQNESYEAPGSDRYPELPMVVLVDGYSASASEIVAGALQDHDEAVIIGSRTYGKGSVQTLFGLPAGNYLKMTTAHWYTPSGRSIQKPRDADARVRNVLEQAVTVSGAPVTSLSGDTTEREVYRTDSGRLVYGGGGITPDLTVMPDTLNPMEQRLRSRLHESGLFMRDLAFKFAVRWSTDHPELRPDFEVDAAMLDAFYRFLTEERDLPVDRELFEEAAHWMSWELGRQVAKSAFGQIEYARRWKGGTPQVRTAAELLHRAQSGQELIALAESRQSSGAGGGDKDN